MILAKKWLNLLKKWVPEVVIEISHIPNTESTIPSPSQRKYWEKELQRKMRGRLEPIPPKGSRGAIILKIKTQKGRFSGHQQRLLRWVLIMISISADETLHPAA